MCDILPTLLKGHSETILSPSTGQHLLLPRLTRLMKEVVRLKSWDISSARHTSAIRALAPPMRRHGGSYIPVEKLRAHISTSSLTSIGLLDDSCRTYLDRTTSLRPPGALRPPCFRYDGSLQLYKPNADTMNSVSRES